MLSERKLDITALVAFCSLLILASITAAWFAWDSRQPKRPITWVQVGLAAAYMAWAVYIIVVGVRRYSAQYGSGGQTEDGEVRWTPLSRQEWGIN